MPAISASFTDSTTFHDFPLLAPGQVQKEFFVNELLSRIDLLLHPAFLDERSDPPSVTERGECYLVSEQATGAWQGKTGSLAGWDGQQWTFIRPRPGMMVRNLASGQLYLFRDQWEACSTPPEPTGGNVVDAEARAIIADIIEQLRIFGIFS